VKDAWAPLVKGDLEGALRRGGLFAEVAPAAVTVKVAGGEPAPAKLDGDASGLTLLTYPSLRFYDGRSAISSWLQEAPDTMTQAVWDAWVEISTETARKLGVVQATWSRWSTQGTLELPAYISPTLHPSAVAIRWATATRPIGAPRYVAADTRSLNPMDILPAATDPTSGGSRS
jgi:anaerobic selenocysteine-containing dehydrogenase